MRCYSSLRARQIGLEDIDTYQLRHIFQTSRPLGLWIAVFIPNVHIGHTVGHVGTRGSDEFR